MLSSHNIYFCKCQTADEKKSKEDEQTLEELNLTLHRTQAKCQLVQTSYIKRIKLFLFLPDFRFSDFYYYALFTKYNKINIYRNYKKDKKKEIKQYITRKIVLSDQSSISFRVGHRHVQNSYGSL